MTDFVYDGTTLPDGKSDYRPNTYPVNKSYTADEWNTVMAAIDDLRSAVLSGQFFGLASTPAATVSASGEVRLRSKAGVLQASENAGTYHPVETAIRPETYGAVGDGVTDDAAAIQLALAAAAAAKKPLKFAAKTYLIGTELDLAGSVHWHIVGTPYINGSNTVLKAKSGSGIRAIMRLQSTNGYFEHLYFDGNRAATYCLWLAGCSLSTFNEVRVSRSTSDGVFHSSTTDSAGYAINDTNCWRGFWGFNCGTLYITSALNTAETSLYGFFTSTNVTQIVAGSCSFASGDNTVTFTGIDVTTLGLRLGDPVRVGDGANKRFGMLLSVTDASNIEVAFDTSNSQCDITASTQGFAIGRGDAFHEMRHGDNNVHTFEGVGLLRGNAGYAFAFDGLYGPKVRGSYQVDFHPAWFIRIGNSGSDPVLNSIFDGLYFETAGTSKPWLLRSAQRLLINTPLDYGVGAGTSVVANNVSYCGNSANCNGIYTSPGNGGIEEIGTAGGCTNKLETTTLGTTYLGGGIVNGPLRFAAGQSTVTANALTRNSSSSSGSAVCRVDTSSGAQTINSIALNTGSSAELLLLGVTGANPATINSGASMQLRSGSVVLNSGDYIALLYNGAVWTEVSRSVGTYGAPPNATGAPGAATQDYARRGRVAIAAGASSVVVTNALFTTSSIVIPVLQTVDGTLTQILTAVPGSGTCTFTGNANATGTTNLAWHLVE